ncbi:peptidoglycan-binding protein [Solirubrum puertoriconensis]|uniref:Peptidoglycan-binding protein n=1 Tax=Solirubrum puertoriconensis TaxID=1751427 RepID=A0A9X0HKP2_SOLP1|nr:peptidoglycan-binding protein [Solirubrum puertoriconensis]KUG07653.1 peptidoglycan-binding protein [Solirubrum puertoriconensis]
MIKTRYQNELTLSATCRAGSRGQDVRRVQEWLSLAATQYPGVALNTAVDGVYGAATVLAVQNLQRALGKPTTGETDQALFATLTAPLRNAYELTQSYRSLRTAVVQIAANHLRHVPRELQYNGQQNLGPWVRSYCNGYDGTDFKWCMGFVQSVLDQAAYTTGRRFTDLMPQSLSCDVVGTSAEQRKTLIRNAAIRQNPSLVQPGDVFLLRNTAASADWYHTGIITRVVGDCFETIEGNTDQGGSSNGIGVFARTRNFRKSVIDAVSISKLEALIS